MTRLVRRLFLLLAVIAPGMTLLLYLADADPLSAGRGARVGRGAVLPEGGTDPSVPLRDATDASFWTERDVRLPDGDGGETVEPFRPWVLLAAGLDQVDGGRAIEGREVRLDMAREPERLEDLRGTVALDARVSARRARLERTGQEWTTVRLTEEVRLEGRDPRGKTARLETTSLRCFLLTRRVDSDRLVTIRRPGLTLSGTGLDAAVDLRRAELKRDVTLEIDLAHADLPWARPPPVDGEDDGEDEDADEDAKRDDAPEREPQPPLVVRCGGPLTMEEIEAEEGETRRIRLEARGGVSAVRDEGNDLDCDALTIVLAVLPGEKGDVGVPISMEVEKLLPLKLRSQAGDNVGVAGNLLTWRRRDDDAWEATVTGSPLVVVSTSDEKVGVISTTSHGPARLLVERGKGFAEAVFRDRVRVEREGEVLTADEATITRRKDSRTLAARGHVVADGDALYASADSLVRTETDDRATRTILKGEPRVVVRGRGGIGLFAASTEEDPDLLTETDVTSGAPIVVVESKDRVTASAGSGVVVVRRAGERELGRLEARELVLGVSRGENADLLVADVTGPVRATGTGTDGSELEVRTGHLAYNAGDRILRLTRDRPRIRVKDEHGITFLQGDSIDWNRRDGDFDARGPVEAQLAGGIDLLALLRSGGPGPTGRRRPHRLTCDRLRGTLRLDEATGKVDLRSARATGNALIDGPAGMARGDRMELERSSEGLRGRISGTPARLELVLRDGRRDTYEGPDLLVKTRPDGGLSILRSPQGVSATVHLEPREEGGTLVRVDFSSKGPVVVEPLTLDVPGGVEVEHRAWNEKKKAWNPPLRLSGRKMTGTFLEEDEKGRRRIETLTLDDDVVVRPEDGSRLTCDRARLDPIKEEIRLEGTPHLEYRLASGRVIRLRWARYRYRPDVEGTRIVVSRFVSPRPGRR